MMRLKAMFKYERSKKLYNAWSVVLLVLSLLYAFWAILQKRCEHFPDVTTVVTCNSTFLVWPILYATFIVACLLYELIALGPNSTKVKVLFYYPKMVVIMMAIVHTAIAA